MHKRKYFRILAYVFVAVLTLATLTLLPHAETELNTETSTESVTDSPSDEGTDNTTDSTSEQETAAESDPTATEQDAAGPDGTTNGQNTSEQTNTGEESLPYQYTYEDDTIIVTAVLSDNTVLPAYSQFCVTPITEATDSTAYQNVEEEISANLKDENQVVTGFLAYDICFIADGVEYEPADGTVTVTIQYKSDLLDQTVIDAAQEVKMLHLKEADDGIEVEDLTANTSISTDPENTTTDPSTTSTTSEVTTSTTPEATTVNNTVQFVTDSFSTFAITGVTAGATATVAVNMQFLTTNGSVDTNVNGTYYLYINRNGYRNTLTLNVASGTAAATLNGLYDQNGNKQNNNQGDLYPLTNDTYTAILFSYSGSNAITANGFRWDENNYATQGYTKYETGSTINETYTITTLSGNVAIANNTGTYTVTATEKAGSKYSRSQLLEALTPVQPFGAFTNYLNLHADMEGNVATQEAELHANFGNSSNNLSNYISSTVHHFTVNKTYAGSTPKTFTFALYKGETVVDTATLTLPTETNETTGTVTFTVHDGADGYTVAELNADGEPMEIDDQNDGYTLTSVDTSTTSSSSALSSTSYIKTFNTSVTTALRNGTTTLKNNLVVGPGYTVKTSGNTLSLKKNGATKMTADKRYCSFTVKSGTFPIDFDSTMSDMEELSASLATAVSSDTVMVKTMTITEYNSLSNSGLTFYTNGKMLLLNIDATNSPGSVSLYANAKLVVNGASCGGFSSEAGNIIVNIYTKSGDTYYPYAGTIHNAGFVMGTLLAPDAWVLDVGQNFNGTIVADYVCNQGGEIHGNTISAETVDTVYDFVNTEITQANYDLPEAGGIGNYLFYGVGAATLTLASAGLFFLQRRNKKKARTEQKN